MFILPNIYFTEFYSTFFFNSFSYKSMSVNIGNTIWRSVCS